MHRPPKSRRAIIAHLLNQFPYEVSIAGGGHYGRLLGARTQGACEDPLGTYTIIFESHLPTINYNQDTPVHVSSDGTIALAVYENNSSYILLLSPAVPCYRLLHRLRIRYLARQAAKALP